MKNKGFTLVEMITVIALLAIIGMISIPVVEGVIKRSKDRVYETQLEEIKSGAKKYATEYIENISTVDGAETIVCLSKLKELGYLENTKIVDPRTDLVMDGGIKIRYVESSKSFKYIYDEDIISCE